MTTVSSAEHPFSKARYAVANAMAGNVSRRSGSVTISVSSPSWFIIISLCEALVAMVMLSVRRASKICRTTLCSIDSIPPPGLLSKGRNCFERALFERGHRRLPDPPESKTIFIARKYNFFPTNRVIVKPITNFVLIMLT